MRERNIGIEYLRVFASLGVVSIHVAALAIRQTVDYGYEIAMIIDAFSRVAVPIFFMISGYLMIQPQKTVTLQMSWSKTKQRVLRPLVFWLGSYFLFSLGFYLWQFGSITPAVLFERFFSGETIYHFWFLPTLAGYYLATPLFNRFVRNRSPKFIWLAIIASFILGFAMQIISVWQINVLWIVLKIFGFSGYYLFGYLIREQKWQLSLPKGVGGYILGSTVTLGTFYVMYQVLTLTQAINLITDNFFPPIILASLCIFSSLIHRHYQMNQLTRCIMSVSPYTFGIYLVHVAILTVLSNLVTFTFWPMITNSLFLIVSVFVSSLLLSYLFQKNAVLRRFI